MAKAYSNEVLRSLLIDNGYYCKRDGKVFNRFNREIGSSSLTQKYIKVTIKGINIGAHRLVWFYFYGDIPDGYEINHINGNKTDNRIENLEAVTKSTNMRHLHATRNDITRLTQEQVHALLDDYMKYNMHRLDIAEKYKISFNHVCDIIKGRFYKDIDHPHRMAA